MVPVLLWTSWVLFQIVVVRMLIVCWWDYRHLRDRRLIEHSPEFLTLCILVAFTLGNAVMRVYVDQKNFYPRTPQGFLNTGYTESQWLCGIAWTFAAIWVIRWGVFAFLSGDRNVRWTLGGLCGIFVLLGTSAVLHYVFQMPLGTP